MRWNRIVFIVAQEVNMAQKVRKAVIPAAGLGTRFLPVTKALPKEMLPIVDTPNIQYIVQEAVNAGIESILIIVSGTKGAIEDHFDYDYELEARLKAAGKEKEAEQVHAIGDLAQLFYVRQKNPRGLGHAILCAKDFVGNEPFAILLGDDLVVPDSDDKPAIGTLIDGYEKTGKTVVGVKRVDHSAICKYASVKPAGEILTDGSPFLLSDMVEKPKPEEAFTDMAILGRYVCTPDVFDILEHTAPGRGNEIQLTDALKAQALKGDCYAAVFPGTRYDIGDKFGFVKATIDFALKRSDIGPEVLDYIRRIVDENKN